MTDPAPATTSEPVDRSLSLDHHPRWAGVGKSVRVVRRFQGHSPDHIVEEHTSTVARHTPSTIVLTNGEKFRRGHPTDPVYRLSPRYGSYLTTLEAVTADGK